MTDTSHDRSVIANPALVSVVDDDVSVRESLPDLLRGLGFAADTFGSAKAFLESKRLHDTRILLLDIAMPSMSGPELQQELARQGYAMPIIFITGQHDQSLRSAMIDSGAVDCLFKPFSEAALSNALDAALEAHP